mgnify:FL=1
MKKLLVLLIGIVLSSCSSQYYLSTLNHDPMYGSEVVLNVPSDVKIDTLSYSQLKWKLRTDFNFRWDFAQYAMDQPYSWYMSNYSFNPFNSFDMYWNRHSFWNEWAFNYPWFNYGWNNFYGGYNSFYNPYRPWWYRSYNPWNNWYNGPFNNPGYNVAWNSSRENSNIAYINGPRGSRGGINIVEDGNNIVTRYNKGDIDDNNQNSIITVLIKNLKDRYNSVRVYNNVDEVPVNINNNNGRPIIYNNNNSKPIRGSWRPSDNSNNNNSYKPVYNNNNNINTSSRIYTRPTGNSSNTSTNTSNSVNKSGGNSRGGNSNKRN